MPVASWRARRGVSLALGAALVVGTVAARPLARADGVTFTYRVTSSRKDQKGAPPSSFLATVRLAGGNMRMDYTEGVNPMAGDGGYIVVRGDDERLAIVNPKDKAVVVMDAALLGSGLGAMLNNPMLKVNWKDQSFTYEDLGAGETILGQRTRKFRLRQKHTVEVRVLGMRRTSTEESVTDQWVATEVRGADARALARWARSFGAGVKVTNPELGAQMERYQKDTRGGLALRSMVVSTRNDGKKTETDTTTMEVVELKPSSMDVAIFSWPADYEVADVGQVVAAARDSMRAQQAREGAEVRTVADTAQERPSAKDAVKGALGGMFGRKKKP